MLNCIVTHNELKFFLKVIIVQFLGKLQQFVNNMKKGRDMKTENRNAPSDKISTHCTMVKWLGRGSYKSYK